MYIFWIAIIASMLLAVCTALEPIFIQSTIDACSTLDIHAIVSSFVCFLFCIIGILVFEFVRRFSIGKYTIKKVYTIKKAFVHKIVNMKILDFEKIHAQDYVTSLNQEVDLLVNNYYVQKLELIYCILVFITSIFALCYLNLLIGAIVVFMTFLPIVFANLQGKKMRICTDEYANSLKKLNVMTGDLIQGYHTIKSNGISEKYEKKVGNCNNIVNQKHLKKIKTEIIIDILIGLLSYSGKVALIGVGTFLIFNNKMTVGTLIGALQLSEMLAIPTNSIAVQLSQMHSVKTIKNNFDIWMKKEKNEDLQKAERCPKINTLELKNVSFKYQDKYILKDINVTFTQGHKYLIVGENGSGKSTLFRLIVNFIDNYEGKILINGRDIREFNDSIYEEIGIVLQSPFMFNDTLLNNITLYQNYEKDSIRAVLNSLGLQTFLKKHNLEDIYQDTKDNLSGGEKQKISLARILLEKKGFILLDEATSAIDIESSFVIEKTLLSNPEITLINIEHKILDNLLDMYDYIYEIRDMKLICRKG